MKKIILAVILAVILYIVIGSLVCYVYDWFAPQVCPDAIEMPLTVGIAIGTLLTISSTGNIKKS